MKKLFAAAAVFAALLAPAFADETIVKEHHDNDAPGIAVKVPVPGVEVRDRDAGCSSTTVHKENDEGDSKTVHKTNCD